MSKRPLYYILDETHQAMPSDDVLAWARCFESEIRQVGLDEVSDTIISTAFLGLDHSYGTGPPILFETMIFGGKMDGYQECYATWDEAAEGHARALFMVRETASAPH